MKNKYRIYRVIDGEKWIYGTYTEENVFRCLIELAREWNGEIVVEEVKE